MALESLILWKKIERKKKELDELRAKIDLYAERAADLETAINETRDLPETTEEEIAHKREAEQAVDEAVAAYEADKEAIGEAEEAAKALESEISDLESELEKQDTEAPEEVEAEEPVEPEKREVKAMIETRDFNKMSLQEREAICQREDVQDFLSNVRKSMMEKRAIENVGLTIPEVFLGLLKANIDKYSKLYKHVSVKHVSGTSRLLIMSQYDEAIWTECCANLNELALTFYQEEYDCFKIGGYYALCQANVEDSDINLMAEIIEAISQAIGKALDKAILYGRNTSANQKMPLGIVSRLVQTAAPSGYPATARPWVDLHETNIQSVAAGTTGAELIQAIVLDFAAAKSKYSNGTKVWCMNENTFTKLAASTITTAADGSIVAGVFGTMPVLGGVIETLDFIPDNVIIAGYFDCYILVERAGKQFATSEHVRFLQDQIVMKGTARYDGAPTIAEAFVAIGLEGVTPDSDMTFAADTANQGA